MKIIYLIVILLIVILIGIGAYFTFFNNNNSENFTGPIVFFGNSITAGVGIEQDQTFPVIIGKELGVEIVNAGSGGNTTADGLARIDDVISQNPGIVVVEFGGNDFLQQVDFNITKNNFVQIMQRLTNETSAKIILAAVRADVLGGKYEEYQKELAKKYDAIFVSNIMKGVISDSELMVDRVHPNAKGHLKIAEKLIKIIKPLVN